MTVKPFYLTIKEVSNMTALGKSSIYRMEQKRRFPKRLTINKSRVVWLYSDIYAWCDIVKQLQEYPPENHYTF